MYYLWDQNLLSQDQVYKHEIKFATLILNLLSGDRICYLAIKMYLANTEFWDQSSDLQIEFIILKSNCTKSRSNLLSWDKWSRDSIFRSQLSKFTISQRKFT